jgi:Arc/MetJ family transcription regulator
MRRTVVIDDALLAEAQDALGTSTIRATIEESLRETVRQRRLRALADSLGTFHMAMTRADLLRQRHREAYRHLSNEEGSGESGVTGEDERDGRVPHSAG